MNWIQGTINLGIDAETPLELQPRVRLSNLMGPVFGVMLSAFIPLLSSPLMQAFFAGTALAFASVPLLNSWKLYLWSRVLLTTGLSVLLMFAGTAYGGDNTERVYLIKTYLFANAIIPLALFSVREVTAKLFCTGLAIACFFGFEWVDARFNILPAAETVTSPMILGIMQVPVPAVFFILLIFLFAFFQQADQENIQQRLKGENQKVEELAAKEAELSAALIRAQEAQQQLNQVNQSLQQSREEAEARAASLATTRDSMRRMVKRLRVSQVEMEGKQAALNDRQMQDAAMARLAGAARLRDDQSFERWADQLLEVMMLDFPQTQAALYAAEPDRLRRIASYAYHYANGHSNTSAYGEGLAGEVARSVTPIILSDLRKQDVRIRAGGLLVIQPDSLMAYPLLYAGELLGVLELTCLYSLTPEQEGLLKRQLEVLPAYLHGAKAQVSIRTLFGEAQHRNELLVAQEEELRQNLEEMEATQDEMKRVQQQLAQQEANLNALINNTLDNIVLLDRNFSVLVANVAMRQRYERMNYDLRPGVNAIELMSREAAVVWREHYEKALAGQRLTFINSLVEDGETRFKEYWVNPIFNNSQAIVGISVFSRDVTDRVLSEHAIRESETKLRELNERLEATVRERTEQVHFNYAVLRTTLETTSEGICVVDNNNRIWDFNSQFADIWRVPVELVQRRDYKLIMQHIRASVKDEQLFQDRLNEILDQKPDQSSGMLELKDGRFVLVFSQRPKRDSNQAGQQISRVWSYRDVTSTYQAERALRENELRFRLFFELTNEGIFLHEKSIVYDANPALGRILGMDPARFIGSDRQEYIVDADLEIARERVRMGYELPFEIRLKHSSGREVPCEIMSRSIMVEGRPMKAVFVRDLTERKQAEDSLTTIAQAIPVALVVITYFDPRIIYVNENAQQLVGLSASDLLGHRSKKLYHYPEDMMRMSTEIIESKGTLTNFEMALHHSDGHPVWTVVNGERLVYQGQDSMIFGFYDITDRRQNEEALRESKQQLEAAFSELRSAKTQVALSEKLALMGQLTAGIAHEINTPLSAAASSANVLSDLLPQTVDRLTRLSRDLPKKRVPLLIEVLEHVGKPKSNLSTRQERALRAQFTNWLTEAGIAEPTEAARLLTELRYEGDLADLADLLNSKHGEEFLETCSTVAQLWGTIDNINVANGKTRRIVQALKRFTHTGSHDTIEPVSIIENLNTILILYAHSIRSTGALDTQFEDEPVVIANPDTLGQVWTNLITNGLQAMPKGGTLGIRVRREGDVALITISDTGTGIPAEILPRIFDPFFTTKKKGEGTGMGLQIVRQIIEGYGGAISVESMPGNTAFTIRLPNASETDIKLHQTATTVPVGG